ncbi:MAG: leucyl/phenylalanyl-tRNA--protein transferase [Alphaproteobacteria bacterium]|nr:leucyl/phenylalanyl-tRNA--protein transferase [Alphaproteobacteria bacterium]
MRPLTPEVLLRAYSAGIFPMARSREDARLYWVDPDERGIIPLTGFHVPRSLRRVLKRGGFDIRCNHSFEQVMALCAEPTPGRPDTWINDQIIRLFVELHHLGLAHSVEAWADGEMVGGLYGLALGGAFFGESMFSRRTDASKAALVHLVGRLRRGGFTLLDTQFVTEHLERFGATQIPRKDYLGRLGHAVQQPARFRPDLDVDLFDALVLPCAADEA